MKKEKEEKELTNKMAKSILLMLSKKSGGIGIRCSIDGFSQCWIYQMKTMNKTYPLYTSTGDDLNYVYEYLYLDLEKSDVVKSPGNIQKQFLEKMLKFSRNGYDIRFLNGPTLFTSTLFLKRGTCLEGLLVEHDLVYGIA